MIHRVYKKVCQVITPKILDKNILKMLHLSVIKYAKVWHPYVDRLADKQIKIFDVMGLDYQKVQLTATGVLQFYIGKKVYLVPCGKLSSESLTLNYINWCLIKDSKYYDLVDYDLVEIKIKDIVYYEMSMLIPLSDKKEAFRYITGRLQQENKKYLFEYIDVKQSIIKLYKHCSVSFEKVIEMNSKKILADIGPMHGDLTAQNMLQTNENKVVMIDLDRFSFEGVQLLDQIHFYIESRSSLESTNWLVLLPKILYDKSLLSWTELELIGYFLYRINAEIRDDIEPVESYKKQVFVCAKQIADYMKAEIGVF